MTSKTIVVMLLAAGLSTCLLAQKKAGLPGFEGNEARQHELKPHRHAISVAGVGHGSNELDLTLKISPEGVVVEAKADAWSKETLAHWPKVKPEVMGWKYTPFEVNGKAVAAEVKTKLLLTPAEKLPEKHLIPPELKADSEVEIRLSRGHCYGTCPVYSVTLSTKGGISYFGQAYVAVKGGQSAPLDADNVRALARAFVAADVYSMDDEYTAPVTDLPTTTISITIDGNEKRIEDYMGTWVGMPAVVKDLEDEVEFVAGSRKWVERPDGKRIWD